MPSTEYNSVTGSRELFQHIVKSINSGIAIFDRRGCLLFWNDWMIQHTGLPLADVEAKNLVDIFPEMAGHRIQQGILDAAASGLSTTLSQAVNQSPLPLYADEESRREDRRIRQLVTLRSLVLSNQETCCLLEVSDVSASVEREQLLRQQAGKLQNLATSFQKNEMRMLAILDNAMDGIITMDESGRVLSINNAAETIFGCGTHEMCGLQIERFIPQLFDAQAPGRRSKATSLGLELETSGCSLDGREFPVEVSFSAMMHEETQHFVCIVRDITDRRTMEDELVREKRLAEVTLSSIADAVITKDTNGNIVYMNPVAESMTGWSLDNAVGQPLDKVFNVVTHDGREPVHNLIETCLENGARELGDEDLILIGNQANEYSIKVSAAPIAGVGDEIFGTVVVFHDISHERQMRRELSYQATHDSLTGLTNRNEFERRLEETITRARVDRIEHTLCYLDLDQFKVVNDTCGHVAGDELLRQVTSLLKSKLRRTDTLARLGGDEFAVLLDSCPMDKAATVAETMRQAIADFRFAWDDKTFSIGVSIGLVSIAPASGDLGQILSAADSACYAAKDQGRNRICRYHADDQEQAERAGEMQWAPRITRALEDDNFELFQQTIQATDIHAGKGWHMEILLRMKDSDGTLIPPGAFIPAAERYNLMVALDRWVFEHTMSFFSANPAALEQLAVCSVNVSGQSLCDERFLGFVVEQIGVSGFPADKLCIEITETAAIGNLSQATRIINALKRMGCKFALDDFGSGLSSFGYLKNLPVDYLKIDGLFVKDMVDDPIDYAMVESINKIGHVMGIETIAEFVEDDAIMELLRRMGVDYGQGYGIAKPEPLSMLVQVADSSTALRVAN